MVIIIRETCNYYKVKYSYIILAYIIELLLLIIVPFVKKKSVTSFYDFPQKYIISSIFNICLHYNILFSLNKKHNHEMTIRIINTIITFLYLHMKITITPISGVGICEKLRKYIFYVTRTALFNYCENTQEQKKIFFFWQAVFYPLYR